MNRQGNSIFRPPLLDGTNFSQWEIRMKVFIKSIDERAWKSVLTGWTPPTIKNEKGEVFIKPEIDWSSAESALSGYNSKALNAIFNAVDANNFDLISDCVSANEAWKELREAYEDNSKVRTLKHGMLCTRFEDLKMDEDDTVSSFYAKLNDIVAEARELGKPFNDAELVSKVLRSLPERFESKISAFEEVDPEDIDLEELVCSLQAFEMRAARWDRTPKKPMTIGALQLEGEICDN